MRTRRFTVAAMAAAMTLSACGSGGVVVERSFTDRHGRACTYVIVEEPGDDNEGVDLDAANIDCDPPPSGAGNP
ncbi:hypothetical protein [Spirillospora sp. CA-294931]|uniref:hypothetical protein n=1 Tax=Spirillospora sp. CA-294931 TaxID=3240042 RepID=UPI003D8F6069